MVYNLNHQNRHILELGLLRTVCTFPAFHIDSKTDYTFQFEMLKGVQVVKLFNTSTNETTFELRISGADLDEVVSLLVGRFRKLRIRLEKDALTMHESKTVLYYL